MLLKEAVQNFLEYLAYQRRVPAFFPHLIRREPGLTGM
jgi:steroid 5-alpha reductase family enzyme